MNKNLFLLGNDINQNQQEKEIRRQEKAKQKQIEMENRNFIDNHFDNKLSGINNGLMILEDNLNKDNE